MSADFHKFDPSVVRLRPRPRGDRPTDHFVEFYDDDSSLVGSVTTFVSRGIAQGDAVLVIADATHREALDDELAHRIDLSDARERGQYLSLDAEEMLARFVEEGTPDPVRFERAIAETIERVSGRSGSLRVFGEMVGVLWARGNVEAAIALEDLWNDFLARHPIRLFCAYPAQASVPIDQAPFGFVCDRHSHVLVPREEPV